MYRASVIIPTYNRPQELTDCIASLLAQTELPFEIIVVDDGELPAVPLEAECLRAGIACRYHKKSSPGLTESRNAGIAMAEGDILFFLDDDVVLRPDYLEAILQVYRDHEGERIGGVGGLIENTPPLRRRDYLKRGVELLFLAYGFREGKVLPSGFCVQFGETPFPIRQVKQVDFLMGGVCSLPRWIFDEFTFTDRSRRFGLGEDKDFTLQVSAKYPLYVTPKAQLLHLEAPAMRPDKRRWGRLFLVGTFLLFKNHVCKHPWQWLFFWYATFGYVLARMLALVVFPNRGKREQLLGTLDAIRAIAKGEVVLS